VAVGYGSAKANGRFSRPPLAVAATQRAVV
jgi:hypothetical protein